jgi:hypothetical protein
MKVTAGVPFNRPKVSKFRASVSIVDYHPQAMTKKLYHWGYYVLATRMATFPPSWRWRIVRRGKPMGVRIEGGGFTTYEAARLAGRRALADFLDQLELEKLRT